MPALKGRHARVLVAGPPAAFAEEPTTADGARKVYQVTDPLRRLWTADAEITVRRSPDGEEWDVVSPAEYTLDRLFGRVIFHDAQPAGTLIRVSGEYQPLSVAAAARSFSYSITATLQERTAFDDPDDFQRRRQTLLDVSGTIGRWYELDPYFEDALASGEPVVIEFWSDRNATAPDLRVRALLAQDQVSAEATGLVEQEVEWEGTADIDGRAVSFP